MVEFAEHEKRAFAVAARWAYGDIAIVREDWWCAGKKFIVLGPAIFRDQWWVPVIDPDKDDPTFFKEAGLMRFDVEKPDGRKNTTGSAFPYRISNAAKARVIEAFEERNCSTHSTLGMTLGVLLEYCHLNKINFRLVKVDHGYYLRKM